MLGFVKNLVKLTYIILIRKCKIYSPFVSAHSIEGKNIEIHRSTVIDKSSKIGSYTYIGSHCFITKSRIGRYCSIANNVSIGQGDHKLDEISTSSAFYSDPFKILTMKDCEIADDVWIGVGAIILRGVSIGQGSVIGANSVVTRSVPEYAIVAGVPATIIRHRLTKALIKKIKKSAWWTKDINLASEKIKKLNNLI